MVFSLVLAAPWGCGGSDSTVDATGEYTVGVTNGQNGCGFQNWNQGDQSSGIPLSITEAEVTDPETGNTATQVTATVGGVTGALVQAILGSNVFTGGAHASRLSLTLFGTRSYTQGGCTYTVNADVNATLSGDVLGGTIDYQTSTNGSPDCGSLEGCTSEQAFNGTRPPST